MSDWGTLKAGLVTLITSLSGLQVSWRNQKRDFTDPTKQARVLLHIASNATLGVDEERLTFNGAAPTGQELTATKCGNRIVTLRIRVESDDRADENDADFYLSRITNRLSWESSLAALRVLNAAYVTDHPTQSFDMREDDHMTSIAEKDFVLGFATNETDAANPGGYITQVDITSNKLKDPQGTDAKPQMHALITSP